MNTSANVSPQIGMDVHGISGRRRSAKIKIYRSRIQWLIIGNIATAIYQTQTLKSYPLWFDEIFGTTVLITRFIERLKKSALSK